MKARASRIFMWDGATHRFTGTLDVRGNSWMVGVSALPSYWGRDTWGVVVRVLCIHIMVAVKRCPRTVDPDLRVTVQEYQQLMFNEPAPVTRELIEQMSDRVRRDVDRAFLHGGVSVNLPADYPSLFDMPISYRPGQPDFDGFKERFCIPLKHPRPFIREDNT